MKHSPLPLDNEGKASDGYPVVFSPVMPYCELDKANSDLIILAVNNHTKLVEALEKVLDSSCDCGYCEEHGMKACTGCKCGHGQILADAEKLLAALKDAGRRE